MSVSRSLGVAFAAALLSGCNFGFGVRADGDAARYFTPGPEARVVIRQAVTLPPRQLRAYFQDGQQVSQKEVNPHYPNCYLEFNAIGDDARTVPAGTYAVTRTERRHAPLAAFEPVQVAALGLVPVALRPGGSPTINFETRFFLQRIEGGAEDIRSLNCAQWGEPGSFDTYPTTEEIARALGAAGSLEL